MDNFRQYYGRQQIEFFHSNTNRVVTVVLGENGRGKTGIYRAMMLALFGDRKLAQDAKEAKIYLANIKAVEESSDNGEGIYVSVQLSFQHHQEDYIIERTYFAMKDDNGEQVEQLYRVRLVNQHTNEEWVSEKEIKNIIQRIIDERVKHYFFFDGERIERLTRVSAHQKQEVTFGIKNLLKIDQVLKSRDVLRNILTKVSKELEQHSTGDYKKAIREMSQLQNHLENLEKKYNDYTQLIQNNHARLAEIDHALHTFDSMQENMKERDQLERDLEQKKLSINTKFDNIQSLNKYLPLMLGEDVFHLELSRLSNELAVGLEEGIKSSFITEIIEDLHCICGNTFIKDSPEYIKLSSLANSVGRYEENKQLYDVQNELKQLLAYLEGRGNQIEQATNEINQLLAEKEQIQYKLDEINHQLGESNEHEVKKLNKERETAITENIQLDHEQNLNLEDQQNYKEKIEKLSSKLTVLERKSGLHQELLNKHKVLEQTVEAMNRMIKKFEADLIEELELTTKQNLYYLLDQSGQEMITEVKVTNDYTLEVLNTYGQPFLANISQGQRQVLSLSFISALAQIAGGTSLLEMPLFMDTPFGRLSGQHQTNLIEYLPQICSQWVLLVTDKEFGLAEQQQFIETGTIGKFYELVSEEAGVTTIKEISEDKYIKGVIQNG